MKRDVLMVVFSHYPADPRVRREAEALTESGYRVEVICLRKAGQGARDEVNGVAVRRLPVERQRAGKARYLWEYLAFIALATMLAAWLHLRRRYALVHVHNMPDILVVSALIPRLFGARVVLDLHDTMPEVFMAKYGIADDSRTIRLLLAQEAISIRLAHKVLTPNKSFRDVFISRGCPAWKIDVVMNSPQETVFAPDARPSPAPGKPAVARLMYHGTVVERHGLDTALTALAGMPVEFHVYGEGDYTERFLEKVARLGLESQILYHGHVSLEEIARAIAAADLGIVPNKRNPFTEINMPTRIFEYLSLGKPVIAPRTRGVMDYFDEESIFLFEPGDAASLRDAIKRALDPVTLAGVLERGREVYARHTWRRESERFVRGIHDLMRGTMPLLPGRHHALPARSRRILALTLSVCYYALVRTLGIIRKRRSRCVTLYYHSVRDDERDNFADQMDELIRLARPLHPDAQPPKDGEGAFAMVTFDDGFTSVVRNAIPELLKRRIPAAFFVPSGLLGRAPDWLKGTLHPDAEEMVIGPEDLRSLPEGLIVIGSHSRGHEMLTEYDAEEVLRLLIDSRNDLEELLDRPVTLLSLPHGAYNQSVLDQARAARYARVFTIAPTPGDGFLAGRVSANPGDWRLEFRLKLLGAYDWLAHAETLKRWLGIKNYPT